MEALGENGRREWAPASATSSKNCEQGHPTRYVNWRGQRRDARAHHKKVAERREEGKGENTRQCLTRC